MSINELCKKLSTWFLIPKLPAKHVIHLHLKNALILFHWHEIIYANGIDDVIYPVEAAAGTVFMFWDAFKNDMETCPRENRIKE